MRKKIQPNDLRWGPYDYPVTPTQKAACSALSMVLHQHSGYFCSQSDNGTVVMGSSHRSVDIGRDGRVRPNISSGMTNA